jgi:hypothetical protein
MGQEPGVRQACEALGVQQVVDGVDEFGVDALVEVLLAPDQSVPPFLRETVEIVHVVRGRHLQGELGVLQREEPAGPRDPVQLVPVDVDFLQQLVVDLRCALAAADDRDAPLLLEFGFPWQILGVVQDKPAGVHHSRTGLRHIRRRSGAENQPPGKHDVGTVRSIHREPVHAVVEGYVPDVRAEAHRVQLSRHPLAVLVVLGAQRIEIFPDVKAVEAPGLLEEVQE